MISADLLRFPHTSQQSSKIDFLDGNLLGNILWLEIPVDSLSVEKMTPTFPRRRDW